MSASVLVLSLMLAPLLAVAATNLVLAPRLHRVPRSPAGPRVSVLIPARDEAENLRRLLPALLSSTYQDLEILVLNDGSTDGTAKVAGSFAAREARVRSLDGTEPPVGWTGKNWACHQLAGQATGEILLFCDADVEPGPGAIGRTVAALDRARADALTAVPRHRRRGWFQQAVVPLVATVPIVTLLPLHLVARTAAASLAMGNGQWFAWRREAYDAVGGHERVRSDVLEDVRLARLAKAHGLTLASYLAPRDLTVRMYRNAADTWEGFTKNLYPLLGGRPWALAVATAALLVVGLGPLLVAGADWAWVPLAELLAIRILAAVQVGDGPGPVLLHPVGVLAAAVLAGASWRRHRTGSVAWKRRTLTHEEPA